MIIFRFMNPTRLRNIFHRLYFDLTDQVPQHSPHDSFYEADLSDDQVAKRLDKIQNAHEATTEFFSNLSDNGRRQARSHFEYGNLRQLIDFVFEYIIRDFCQEHRLNPEEKMTKDLFSDNKELLPDRRQECGKKCCAFANFVEQWSPRVKEANYATAGHRKKVGLSVD